MPLDIIELIFICIQMRNLYNAYATFEILTFKNLGKKDKRTSDHYSVCISVYKL